MDGQGSKVIMDKLYSTVALSVIVQIRCTNHITRVAILSAQILILKTSSYTGCHVLGTVQFNSMCIQSEQNRNRA